VSLRFKTQSHNDTLGGVGKLPLNPKPGNVVSKGQGSGEGEDDTLVITNGPVFITVNV
jgi:hypothetical protein